MHLYAVTNRHVLEAGFRVLRLNTHDGKTDTIETQWSDWEFLPESGDVAVKPLELSNQFRWHPIMLDDFITQSDIKQFNILQGDETYMIGRLINQSGRQRNTPVVRFGHLSMMADPLEPVSMEPYGEHEAFLVECRSVSGFSGSPIILYTTQIHGSVGQEDPRNRKEFAARLLRVEREHVEDSFDIVQKRTVKLAWIEGTFGPWFLGVDRGHVPLWKPVFENGVATKHRVEHNTGMAIVIPAWRIRDILEKDDLVKQRKDDDDKIAKNLSSS